MPENIGCLHWAKEQDICKNKNLWFLFLLKSAWQEIEVQQCYLHTHGWTLTHSSIKQVSESSLVPSFRASVLLSFIVRSGRSESLIPLAKTRDTVCPRETSLSIQSLKNTNSMCWNKVSIEDRIKQNYGLHIGLILNYVSCLWLWNEKLSNYIIWNVLSHFVRWWVCLRTFSDLLLSKGVYFVKIFMLKLVEVKWCEQKQGTLLLKNSCGFCLWHLMV